MKKNDKYNFPYLALEERPNSFVAIDLSHLDILNNLHKNEFVSRIEQFDQFFASFSKEEIIESIKRSNTVLLDDYNVPLIIRYKMHSYPLITKDNISSLNIVPILEEILTDRNLATKFRNKYNNIAMKLYSNIASEESLKEHIKEIQGIIERKDLESLCLYFTNLPYEGKRELAFYFYENEKSKDPEQKLQRKTTEKG